VRLRSPPRSGTFPAVKTPRAEVGPENSRAQPSRSHQRLRRFLERLRTAWTIRYYGEYGHRQAYRRLADVRPDHRGRYTFACNYVEPAAAVMDCAAGTGYGAFILARSTEAEQILAVERSARAVRFGRRHYRHPRIRYLRADIFRANLQAAGFDCIASFETLEHVDGEALLRVFHRCLKPDGILLISTPNQETMPFDADRFPFHRRHYSPAEFEVLLKQAGFTVTERHSQEHTGSAELHVGWDGRFLTAVAKKSVQA